MIQKRKTTPKENLLHTIARNVADIKDNMATKIVTKNNPQNFLIDRVYLKMIKIFQ